MGELISRSASEPGIWRSSIASDALRNSRVAAPRHDGGNRSGPGRAPQGGGSQSGPTATPGLAEGARSRSLRMSRRRIPPRTRNKKDAPTAPDDQEKAAPTAPADTPKPAPSAPDDTPKNADARRSLISKAAFDAGRGAEHTLQVRSNGTASRTILNGPNCSRSTASAWSKPPKFELERAQARRNAACVAADPRVRRARSQGRQARRADRSRPALRSESSSGIWSSRVR